jgi:hypothetical protein
MALNDLTVVKRGSTNHPHLQWGCDKLLAASTINAHRLCSLDTTGKLAQSSASDSKSKCIGVNDTGAAIVAGQRVPLARGFTVGIADDALTPGTSFKAGDGGRIIGFNGPAQAATVIKTTGNGLGFGNQPANDGVEVLSSSAADTTQTATIIGTTTGTDTVVVETVALNGTTPVSTVKTDWGFILAVKLSASCAGTITFREASADATITTVLTTVLSKGVELVTAADQQAYNVAPTGVGSGSGTKTIGLQGTNSAGTTVYTSKALNGTTAITFPTALKRVTEVYVGDLETNRTTTIATGAAETENLRLGSVLTLAAAQGDAVGIVFNGA